MASFMSEHFTIRLPDEIRRQTGQNRKTGIQQMRDHLEKKRPAKDTEAPDLTDVRINVADHGDEYCTVTIHGSSEQAKAIMDASNLKIMNLLVVELPESIREHEPPAIAKMFDALGKKITERIREYEFKKRKSEDDTMPIDTIVKTYEIADDRSSVVLHVDGNMQLTRDLLIKKAGLKLLGA